MTEPGRARVHMVWPEELKRRVVAKVGRRGITDFVIQAVETALAGGAVKLAPAKEATPPPPAAQDEQATSPLNQIRQTYGLVAASELLRDRDIEVDF